MCLLMWRPRIQLAASELHSMRSEHLRCCCDQPSLVEKSVRQYGQLCICAPSRYVQGFSFLFSLLVCDYSSSSVVQLFGGLQTWLRVAQ